MLSEKRSLSLNSLTENPTQGDYGAMEFSVFFVRSQDGKKLWVMVSIKHSDLCIILI